MKINALETVRIDEFPNLCYVLVHTDEGISGLGETFFGAQAVAAWVHESAGPYLLGRDPLQIDRHWVGLNPFVGFNSTAVESRGRSAIDIALWDLLGRVCNQPIYQLLGGASHDRIRTYNTCAGYRYVRKAPGGGGLPIENWGMGAQEQAQPYEDLDAFMNHADELAHSLLEQGITGMKNLALRSLCRSVRRPLHLKRRSQTGTGAVSQDPRSGRRPHGDHGRTAQPVGSQQRAQDRPGAGRVQSHLV